MDGIDFDRLSRRFGAAATRRGALAAAFATLAGSGFADARKAGLEGPCGDGSAKANRCAADDDCCTGVCNTKRRRCRCRQRGSACTANKNCCNSLTCIDGVCGRSGGGGGCGTCPDGTHCVNDACVACTVCASGCPYADLVAALADAGGPSEILIAPGTYTGPHAVTRPVTIDRCGSTGTVTLTSATASSNVLNFQPAATVSTVRNVTVSDVGSIGSLTGVGSSGGVDLTMGNVIVENMGSGVFAGGLTGSLTMTDCQVRGSTIESGVKLSSTGGITLTMTNCTIENNTTTNVNVGGGGISLMGGVTATLIGTTIQNNTAAGGNGGGIVLFNVTIYSPTLTIGQGTIITGNSATGNVSGSLGLGGGIAIKKGTVTGATASNVTGNTATEFCNNMFNFDTFTCDLV